MDLSITRFPRCLAFIAILLCAACGSVPPQSVQLSESIGIDLVEVQSSYETLVETHFDLLKSRRMNYLEQEWIPAYIEKWVVDGKLREVASGTLYFDQGSGSFLNPTPGKEEQQLLSTIVDWSDAAIQDIEDKRTSLIEPLEQQKRQLLADVRSGFAEIQRANAAITALLQSLVDLDTSQQEILDRVGLSDFTQSITDRLIETSNAADAGLSRIREMDEL